MKMSSPDRLSSTSYIVLSLIDAAGEATPYDLKRAVAATIGNFWSVPHAQVYAEPERLAVAGYLSERREQGGRRRRYYKLSPRGEKALQTWRAEPTDEMAELRDPGILKLFFGGDAKPLAEAQLSVHQRRLDELEELMRRVADQPQVPRGVVLTFQAGLGHEREWVRFWEAIARGETP
jgi:PadR family transcriptional regulator AphA